MFHYVSSFTVANDWISKFSLIYGGVNNKDYSRKWSIQAWKRFSLKQQLLVKWKTILGVNIFSCAGLSPKEHLGKTLAEMRPILVKLVSSIEVDCYEVFSFVLVHRQKNMVLMCAGKEENLKVWRWIVAYSNINASFCKRKHLCWLLNSLYWCFSVIKWKWSSAHRIQSLLWVI